MNHNQFQEPGHDALLSWDNNLSLKRNEAKSKDNEKYGNKQKHKVGELGTLGTLKNLSKILNFQEQKLNGAKSVKQILFDGNQEPIQVLSSQQIGTLGSHQLHKKQMQLMKQASNNESSNMLNSVTQLPKKSIHRPSSSSQLGLQLMKKSSLAFPLGGPKQNQQSNDGKLNKTQNLQKLNQTIAGVEPRSKSKNNNKVNQIIKKNLKKNQQKIEQKQHEEAIKYERELLKRREIQMQNDLVRQINKEKIQKQKSKGPQQNELQVQVKSSKIVTTKHKEPVQREFVHDQYQNQIQDDPQSAKITNLSMIGNEPGFPYRRSQERGNQRMTSGSGGKSGSRGASLAGRSGRSGGQIHVAGNYYHGDNSAHAGGKKDSLNSNLSQQQMKINNEQSQQIQSLDQGGFQLSQKMDSSILRQANQWQVIDGQSEEILDQNQDDSILRNTTMTKKGKKQNRGGNDGGQFTMDSNYLDSSVQFQKGLLHQQSEDMRYKKKSLNRLDEEMENSSYNNTKNISQLLKEEQSNENLREMFMQNKNQRSQKLLQNNSKMGQKLKNQGKKKITESSDAIGLMGLTSYGNKQRKEGGERILGASQTHKLGLDYLDVKKEIQNELKQVDKKGMEKLNKKKNKDNTMVIFQDNSVQDLRIENFINNLQRQLSLNKLRSKSSSPQIRKEDARSRERSREKENQNIIYNKNKEINISTTALQTNKLLTKSQQQNFIGRLGSQSSLSNLQKVMQGGESFVGQNKEGKRKNTSIQKFIKTKQDKLNRQQVKEKQEEISKAIRQKQNLDRLEALRRKKLQQSFNHQHQNSISAAVLQLPEFMREKKNAKSKNRNRSASRERKIKKESDRVQADIQEMINDNSIQKDPNLENQQDYFNEFNIFNNQFSGNTIDQQPVVQHPVVDEYNNLDVQLKNFLKNTTNKKKDNNSFTSASLREFGAQVTDQFEDAQHTPTMKKMKQDKMKRSKSQQRCMTSGFPQTSPNINNRKTVFQFQNKIKTIDQGVDFRKQDKSNRKVKQQSITHRNNQKMSKFGKSQIKMSSNKKKANSASKSRSRSNKLRNRKSSSKSKSKSKSKSRNNGKQSRSLPDSNSPHKSNSQSKSRSHSRSNRNVNGANRKSAALRFKKSSRSPQFLNDQINLSQAQRRAFDPINNSDFDYNRFMHGTIKISPRITKLSQYVKHNKPSKNNSQNQRRRRNRSCTKTHNQIQLMKNEKSHHDEPKKTKSQQNAHSLERYGDLSATGGLRKIKEQQRGLKIDKQGTSNNKSHKNIQMKDAQKPVKPKKNKTLVNQDQLQEILRKVNLNQYKEKGKKKKKDQQHHNFIDVQDQSQQIENSLKKSRNKMETSQKLENSLQKKIIKNQLQQIEQEIGGSEEFHQEQNRPVQKAIKPVNTRVSKSQPQKKEKISDKEKQKQLKELLRQIHKKNEELQVQQEMNNNLKLATELQNIKKPPNVGDYSSVSSSKRNMERFQEKWVDIPINHHQQTSLKGSQLKNNRFSELSGNQSQKSINNFTFFDRGTSVKEFKNGKSSQREQSIGNNRNNKWVIDSSGGDRNQDTMNMRYEEDEINQNKLQKLYLGNIDMDGSSSNSIHLPITNSDISKNINHKSQQRLMDHLKMPITESNGGALMSSRSGRSGQSGILAQIQGLRGEGQVLRPDNEQFYQYMLAQQAQYPTESHRSITSSNTYNLNLMNQEIMVLGSTNIVGSQDENRINSHESVKQKQLKQKFLTENIQDSQKQNDRKNFSSNRESSEVSSSKYVQGFQSKDNKLSSQMNLEKQEFQESSEAIGQSRVKKHIAPTATAHVQVNQHHPRQENQHHPRQENKDGLHLTMPNQVDEIRRPEASFSQSIEQEESLSPSQKSLKISQINVQQTLESQSNNQVSGNDQKPQQSQNSFDKQFGSQSLPSVPYSLMSHNSKSHRSDQESDKKEGIAIMQEIEQGPHTLISHLNEPQTDGNGINIMNEENENESDPQVKFIQQISPLETNVLPDEIVDKITPAASSAQNSEKQQTAENLLKYLDNKYKEKKQENSSQFDHSRASVQSEQQVSYKEVEDYGQNMSNRYKVNQFDESQQNSEEPDEGQIDMNDIQFQIQGIDVLPDEEQDEDAPSAHEVSQHTSQYCKTISQKSKELTYGSKERSHHSMEKSNESRERSQRSIERSLGSRERSHRSKERSQGSRERSIGSRERSQGSKERSNEGSNSDITSPALHFNRHRERSDKLDEFLDIKIDEQMNQQVKQFAIPPTPPPKEDTKTQIVMHIEDYEDKTAKNEQIDDSNDIQKRKISANEAVPEMVITSNLTTLNLDGGDSSSDGGGTGEPKTVLDAFRKRQARMNDMDAINREDNNSDGAEIDIQENQHSPVSSKNVDPTENQMNIDDQNPISPKFEEQQTKELLQVTPMESEEKKTEVPHVVEENNPIINISALLNQADDENQKEISDKFCKEIVLNIVKNFDKPKRKISTEPPLELKSLSPPKTEKKKKMDITAVQIYNFISSSINQTELKNQIKQVIEMKQRQYIENDLIKSDDYINELLSYLMQFEMLTQHQLNADEMGDQAQFSEGHKALLEELGGINYLIIFLKNLTNPIKKNLVDILNQLQNSVEGSYTHFESVQDPLKFPIIPIDVYLDVEKQREFEFQMNRQQQNMNSNGSSHKAFMTGQTNTTQGTASVLQESAHILNKSIFDAMNESLTKFRPYGVIGEPLPWSNKYRRLQTEVDINSVDTERLIQMVKQEVFRWMSTQQGALNHTHDTIFQYIDLQIPYMPDIQDKITIEALKKEFAKKDKKKDEPVQPSIEAAPAGDDKEKQTESAEKEKKAKEEKEAKEKEEKEAKEAKEKAEREAKQKEEEEKNKMPQLDKGLGLKPEINKEEPKPEEKKEGDTGISQKAADLQKTQDEQFQKFKKNLIENATQELRQSKLANQLQQEILEDEHFWLNYEFEETQIRVDMGNMIFNQLMEETISFLKTKEPKDASPGPEIQEIKE